ncbi:30S ribosomal protein S2 [Nitrosotalea sinensis]|jgi:small subunit ribosomal protein S2|uniref:Small ribosomal subunit protein uS2 n=1 Tax=Nitrosotalea sinensis TaxID=1499975 RepID=A0A2H1EE04_9ARCH|nr:30S ribosomal protein S2 [Candidatus Nitrosotalea sinensis]SHO42570.1 30S ribosomal protein S2 [Candidatus Nitrosotalea sinensis]
MSKQEELDHMEKYVLSTGIRVGTQVKTKFMTPFVTKATNEGLYIIDSKKTLSRIQTAAKFINRSDSTKIIVCSGREYASTPVEKFCEVTGTTPMLGRFMPGTLTNPSLPYYIEPQLVFVSDPQVDEQAVIEATNAGIPVIGISNTDNVTSKLDLVIPANNRGRKSLAAIYWLLAREILLQKGKIKNADSMQYQIDDFETKITEEELEEETERIPPQRTRTQRQ